MVDKQRVERGSWQCFKEVGEWTDIALSSISKGEAKQTRVRKKRWPFSAFTNLLTGLGGGMKGEGVSGGCLHLWPKNLYQCWPRLVSTVRYQDRLTCLFYELLSYLTPARVTTYTVNTAPSCLAQQLLEGEAPKKQQTTFVPSHSVFCLHHVWPASEFCK